MSCDTIQDFSSVSFNGLQLTLTFNTVKQVFLLCVKSRNCMTLSNYVSPTGRKSAVVYFRGNLKALRHNTIKENKSINQCYNFPPANFDPSFFPKATLIQWLEQTLSDVEPNGPLLAPSWKDGNKPESCSFSQHPLTTCWFQNTPRTQPGGVCVCTVPESTCPFSLPTATYVKWCVWWRRRR